jgi:hypothetical protein
MVALVGMRVIGRWIVALTVVLGAPGTVGAENERALSLGVGYATFSAPGIPAMPEQAPPAVSPTAGGALVVAYERALSTDLSLRAEGGGGVFYGGDTGDQGAVSYAGLVDVGVTLRFDVLEWVPYGFAGAGAVATGGGPLDRGLEPVLVVGGGVDKLLGRTRAFGGEVRVASFGGDVTVVTINLRASVRWGFF